jgi:hypothetical protein
MIRAWNMKHCVGCMNNVLMACKRKSDLEIPTSLERVEGAFECNIKKPCVEILQIL